VVPLKYAIVFICNYLFYVQSWNIRAILWQCTTVPYGLSRRLISSQISFFRLSVRVRHAEWDRPPDRCCTACCTTSWGRVAYDMQKHSAAFSPPRVTSWTNPDFSQDRKTRQKQFIWMTSTQRLKEPICFPTIAVQMYTVTRASLMG